MQQLEVGDLLVYVGTDKRLRGRKYKVANIDIDNYNKWNENQKKIFLQSAEQAVYEREVLNDLLNTFPDDERLVKYCKESLELLDQASRGLVGGINLLCDDLIGSGEIIVKNYLEDQLRDLVNDGAKKLITKGIERVVGEGAGGSVTFWAKTAGFTCDFALGTSDTIQTLEDVDILYTDIENSSN